MDIDGEGAGLAFEESFDEPDAADAGEALEGEGEGGGAGFGAGLFFGFGGEGLEPGEIAGFEGAGFDGGEDSIPFEFIETLEVFGGEELVDESAAGAAEFVVFGLGFEGGAAVFAGEFGLGGEGGGWHGWGNEPLIYAHRH